MTPELVNTLIDLGGFGVFGALFMWFYVNERADRKHERAEHRVDRESLVNSLHDVSNRYHTQAEKTATAVTELTTLLRERLPKGS